MNIENTIVGQLIDALLVLIPLGGAARLMLCGVSAMWDEEKKGELKRRGRNVVAFVAFAEVVVGLVNVVYHYYR